MEKEKGGKMKVRIDMAGFVKSYQEMVIKILEKYGIEKVEEIGKDLFLVKTSKLETIGMIAEMEKNYIFYIRKN